MLLLNDPIGNLLGTWSTSLTDAAILFRIALSIFFAAVIGCERSSKRHSAGLRTFILVAFGSTVAMILDLFLISTYHIGFPFLSAASIVSAAMISGNSILFSSRNQIKGLTTSAGLWASAIFGLTIGAGLYTVALIVFAALVMCLSFFPVLEKYLKDRSNHFEVHLELKNRSNLQDFVSTIRRLGLRIDDIEYNHAYLNSGLSVYSISMTIQSPELKKYKEHSEIIEALRSLDYVSHIEEMS